MFGRLKDFLLLALLFLLPWQTRLIYQAGSLDNRYWEYGTLAMYASELLLWLLVLLFVVERLRQPGWWIFFRAQLQKIPWQVVIAIVVLAILIGRLLANEQTEVAWQQLVYILGAICLAGVIAFSSLSWKKIATAFWLGGVVQGALALVQFFNQHIPANKWFGLAYQSGKVLGSSVIEFGDERWLRAYGAFGSPNTLGIYLAVVWIIGLLLYTHSSPKHRVGVTLGQAIVLIGLVLSFSRGAWIAACAGLLLWTVMMVKEKKYSLVAKQYVFSGALVVTLVIMLFPLFFTRLQVSEQLEVRSVSERKSQYNQAWELFSAHPFMGVGLRQYTFTLKAKHPEIWAGNIQPVHNAYLMLLVELGLIGAVLMLWVISKIQLHINWQIGGTILSVLAVAALFDHSLWNFYSGLLLVGTVFGIALKKA